MIASLRGKLIDSDAQSVVVECGGVGYRCFTSRKTLASLPDLNSDIFLYTYLVVREDAMDLYGFGTKQELDCYRLITSVNGVGAKIGIAVLSEFSPDQVALFIASGDSKSLTGAAGVGAKLAQRIILELKDKVATVTGGQSDMFGGVVTSAEHPNARDAIDALMSLGFSKSEASLAVGRFDPDSPADVLIKEALRVLSK